MEYLRWTSIFPERRAMMAGAAEFFANLYGLPKPVWVDKPEYFLAVMEYPSYLATEADDVRIPLLNNALAAARSARLVLTIPGTKTIELAVLGKPAIAITPLNAPELVTINGPLTYLNRVPLVGVPLKRAVAVAVARRFPYHTQPNMDAGDALIRELHGTVTPGRIARVALDSYDDDAWISSSGTALAALYRDHVGAAERMADSLLRLAA